MNEETEPKPRPRRKTTTETIPPEGVEAKVTISEDASGQIRNKRIEYHAEVKPKDAEDEDDIETKDTIDEIDFENLNFEVEEKPLRIPQTPVEFMFQKIRNAIALQGVEDGFFARVIRLPDAINRKFNIPCSAQIDLGVFQFSSRDGFSFMSAIQEKNDNSGGYFNVRIYTLDHQPLMTYRRDYATGKQIENEVGLLNYPVPDPPRTETVTGNGQINDNALLQYMEKTERRFEMLFERINTPPAKNPIEDLLMQKALDMVMNPQQRNTVSIEESIANALGSVHAVSAIGAAFARVINKEPPLPPEPDGFDKFNKILEAPIVQNLLNGAINVSEKFALSKIEGQAETVEYEETETVLEMKELTKTLIAELESDRPLDATNEVIQTLQVDYPEHVDLLKDTCQMLDFANTVNLLVKRTSKMNPPPFARFIDNGEWNENGKKMIVRLKEFYDFVRTQE